MKIDANTAWVLWGTALLGISSGVLGSFALLRRRSLFGDALAHAALPGVCAAYLITSSRDLAPLLLGALGAGGLGAACVQAIGRSSKIKEDSALGIVLSVFFAVGIVLLTMIQHSGRGNQAGLDKYIFGQAASMVRQDIFILAVCAVVVLFVSILCYKEMKLLCFDAGFAGGVGFSPALLDAILLFLLVFAVVLGMQSVGIVLMSALLVIPAATARLWTGRLGLVLGISAFVGAFAGVVGTLLSLSAPRLPTGPLIVLAASFAFMASLLGAPSRGVIPRWARSFGMRKRVARENVLRSLYEIVEREGPWDRFVRVGDIAEKRSRESPKLRAAIQSLTREGLLRPKDGAFAFTESGLAAAYAVVRNYRLWEVFLMHEGQLGLDHVDRDADAIEHVISEKTVRELERHLHDHGLVPGIPPRVSH